jgi:hypothetical protein
LVKKSERKKPLGRSRRRWDNNITIYVKEMGWDSVDWIHLAQAKDL